MLASVLNSPTAVSASIYDSSPASIPEWTPAAKPMVPLSWIWTATPGILTDLPDKTLITPITTLAPAIHYGETTPETTGKNLHAGGSPLPRAFHSLGRLPLIFRIKLRRKDRRPLAHHPCEKQQARCARKPETISVEWFHTQNAQPTSPLNAPCASLHRLGRCYTETYLAGSCFDESSFSLSFFFSLASRSTGVPIL